MRFLIISDIHANLAAFEAVLADAKGQYDMIWCLGDVIGYGPDPNECVELLRQHNHIGLAGNHDHAILGKLNITGFNPDAKHAVQWAQDILNTDAYNYLDALPSKMELEEVTIAHASPRQPVWEYILTPEIAYENFDHFDTAYCIVGHSHVPVIYALLGPNEIGLQNPRYDEQLPLDGKTRLIFNPGSVGQPRDSDPRAAYAIIDLANQTWVHKRVVYDIELTQQRMRQHNLPSRLISRLSHGW